MQNIKPPIGLLTFSIPLIVEKMTARQVADDPKTHLLIDSEAGVVHFGQAILDGVSLHVGIALPFGIRQHEVQQLFLQTAVLEVVGDQQLGDGKDSGAFGAVGIARSSSGMGRRLYALFSLQLQKASMMSR